MVFMNAELGLILSAITLLACIALVLYFRSEDSAEKDTTQVAINDVYFRRLFVPLSLTLLIFFGVFLIIRGAPGIEYSAIKF
jgi:hypothetical protein